MQPKTETLNLKALNPEQWLFVSTVRMTASGLGESGRHRTEFPVKGFPRDEFGACSIKEGLSTGLASTEQQQSQHVCRRA